MHEVCWTNIMVYQCPERIHGEMRFKIPNPFELIDIFESFNDFCLKKYLYWDFYKEKLFLPSFELFESFYLSFEKKCVRWKNNFYSL